MVSRGHYEDCLDVRERHIRRPVSVELGRDGAGVIRANFKILASLVSNSLGVFAHHDFGSFSLKISGGKDARDKGIVDSYDEVHGGNGYQEVQVAAAMAATLGSSLVKSSPGWST